MNDLVKQARQMAIKAHGNQMYGDKPYVVHLDAVADLVDGSYTGAAPPSALIVAYLHDTLEDTDLTVAEIKAGFGLCVSDCVALVTDPDGPNRKARKAALHARLAAVDGKSVDSLALVVKAADRLANVRASVETFVITKKEDLILMYWKEHDIFTAAVYRKGLNDKLFEKIADAFAFWQQL